MFGWRTNVPKVQFVPLGKDREVKPGATILSAANQVHVPIGQSCMGDGICGWCRVRVLEGLEHLAPPSELERKLMQSHDFSPEERAACLAKVKGDVVVTTTYW
jgi:ferredoxin